MRLLLLSCLCAGPWLAQAAPEAHYVGTLAGSPTGLQTARDGPRASAVFRAPRQAVVDAQGAVWVADTGNHLVRRISAGGEVLTLAGQRGVSGFADGPGAQALFNEPSGVLPAAQGGVWVLDSNNGRIRHVAADGRVRTLAGGGTGANGSRHADGTGTAAAFNEPRGFAQDAAGNLYVADYQNQVLRKVTPAGVVSTLAGAPGQQGSVDGAGAAARFSDPQAVAVDANGVIYVADTGPTKAIRRVTATGVVSTRAGPATGARLSEPRGLAVLADGRLLVADAQAQQVLAVDAAGTATAYAGQSGKPGADDGRGTAARLDSPMGLGAGPDGSVLVADSGNHLLRQLQGDTVVTWAGVTGHSASVDGDRLSVRFEDPYAVAVDSQGNAYLADAADHAIRKVDALGRSTLLAGQPGRAGYADGAGSAALFRKPAGLAVGGDGSVYVADSGNHALRRIAPDGRVSTVAGNGERGSRDGTGAQFNEPMGVALAPDGSLRVADFGNHTVRQVSVAGLVSTVAGTAGQGGFVDGSTSQGRLRSPVDVAVDAQGQVYILDRSNHAVRVLSSTGMLSTLAGSGSAGHVDGVGRQARFQFPTGLTVDATGQVWVADTDNQVLRHIAPDGTVSTPMGQANRVGLADGVGAAARFFNPKDVAAGPDGRLWVVDRGNHALRVAQPLARGTVAIDCLLDWGERSYPELLAPAALSQTAEPYRYRAYAAQRYVGVSSVDQQLYLLDGAQLTALGPVAGFLPKAGCVAP